MKIIYRSYDGEEFDTEEECIEYEDNYSPIRMWSKIGRTTKIEDCSVVVIETNESVQKFCDISRVEGLTYEGIDEPGLYFWNSEDLRYDKVSGLYNLDALNHYLNDR